MAALLVAGALSACGGLGGAPLIQRTVGERTRVGIFVSPRSYEHFLLAELALASGDLRRAAQEYEAARAGPEDDVLLVARLADVYDRLELPDRADEMLRQGAQLDPDSETIHLARGHILARRGELDAAEQAFARAAAAAPASEAGPLALAALMRERGQPDRADAALSRYLARAEGAGAARARLALAVEHRDPHAAADAVRALLEVAPARAAEVREAVLVALDADRPELAIRLLEAVPEVPDDRALRVRAFAAARRPDRAEAILAAWMPQGPTELLRVADGYLAVGRPERAHDLAEVAVRGDGGPAARLMLGRALRAMGRADEGAVVLSALSPGSGAWPEAPLELAAALRDLGRPSAAAEALASARARRDDPRLALALGAARLAAGDPEGALDALAGEEARLVAARARVHELSGAAPEAASLYARLDPDAPSLSRRARTRAMVERAAARGELEAAVERLRAWTERAPEDLAARVRLVELTAEAGGDTAALRAALAPLLVDEALTRRLQL